MDAPGKVDENVTWAGWGDPLFGYVHDGKSPNPSMVVDFGPWKNHTVARKILGEKLFTERQAMRFKARRDRLPWYRSIFTSDEDLPLMLEPRGLLDHLTGWAGPKPSRSVLFFNPDLKFSGDVYAYSDPLGGFVTRANTQDNVHEWMPGHNDTYPIVENDSLYRDVIANPVYDLFGIKPEAPFDDSLFFNPNISREDKMDYLARYNYANNYGIKNFSELARMLGNTRDAVAVANQSMPDSFYSVVDGLNAHRSKVNRPGSLLYGVADHYDISLILELGRRLKLYDKEVADGKRKPDPRFERLKEELDYVVRGADGRKLQQQQLQQVRQVVPWAAQYVDKHRA